MQKESRNKGACFIYAAIAVLNGVSTAALCNWVFGPALDALSGELLSAIVTMAAYMLLTARRARNKSSQPHTTQPGARHSMINAAEASRIIRSVNS